MDLVLRHCTIQFSLYGTSSESQIDPQSTDYTNYFLRFHNITISIALVLLYGIMAAIWTRREHVVSSNYVSRLQASILTQSIIISATYAVPAICFVLMYYIKDCPAWFTMVADLSYQLSGGKILKPDGTMVL
ncbi:hypothetical protein B9Z55_010628 [Caenorhabditis nigoni]|nr:hypothetical protein B9Z55_010628 [Caenorhabditis nigoni]